MQRLLSTSIIRLLFVNCLSLVFLNKEQSSRIESIQKRALKIIYGPGDYSDICVKQGLPTLASRRTEICTSFFNNSVLKKNSCLH